MCVKACQVIWGMRLADIHHIQGLLPIQLSHIVNTRKFPPTFPGSRLAHCTLKTILYYWNLGGIHFVSKRDLYTAGKKKIHLALQIFMQNQLKGLNATLIIEWQQLNAQNPHV